MAETPSGASVSLTIHSHQPLIGIPLGNNQPAAVQYFTSAEAADDALADDNTSLQLALSAIGSWSDVDPDEMLDTLDRIRRTNEPTPPIHLDV